MGLASRSCRAAFLIGLLGGVLAPGAATAAPIVVEYEITGGQAAGEHGPSGTPFLDHALVSSGRIVVSIDCGGGSCPAAPTVAGAAHASLSLQFTNGAAFQRTLPFDPAAGFPVYFGKRGPGKSMSVSIVRSIHPGFTFYSFVHFRLRADAQGVITDAFYRRNVSYPTYTPYGPTYFTGYQEIVNGLVGQEVATSVPEPRSAPAIAAAVLGLAGWLALRLRRARS